MLLRATLSQMAAAAAAAAAPTTPAAAVPTPLKVATFNILANTWVKKKWFQDVAEEFFDLDNRLALIVWTVAVMKADIVCFQEVDATSYPFLKKSLSELEYVMSALSDGKSSSPVKNGTAVAFKPKTAGDCKVEIFQLAGMGACMVTIPGIPCRLINIHLDWQEQGGREQLEALIALTSKSPREFAVIGDWNILAEDMKSKAKPFLTVNPVDELGLAFSRKKPPMRIDHGALMAPDSKGVLAALPSPVSHLPYQALINPKKTSPIDGLRIALLLCGSDHLPSCFSFSARA